MAARPKWTRATYEMVAETLNREYRAAVTANARTGIMNVAAEFARQFGADNPRFDRQRFYNAVEESK